MVSIKGDLNSKESCVQHTFIRLEEIGMSRYPLTQVLKADSSLTSDSIMLGRRYLMITISSLIICITKVWILAKCTCVDYLHLVAVELLLQEIEIRSKCICSVHDKDRYMVVSEHTLALHLLVRCDVCAKSGLDKLSASTAFFSSVYSDMAFRKVQSADCATPSSTLGLEARQGIEWWARR